MKINQRYKYWLLSHNPETNTQQISTHWAFKWSNVNELITLTDEEVIKKIEIEFQAVRPTCDNIKRKHTIEGAFAEYKIIVAEHNLVEIKFKTIMELCIEASSLPAHNNNKEFGTLIAVMHTKVKSICETENAIDYTDELANILIGVFDICGYYQIDLEKAFIKNMAKNTLESIIQDVKNYSEEYNLETKAPLELHNLISNSFIAFNEINKDEEKIAETFFNICINILQTAKTDHLNIIEVINKKIVTKY